MDRYIPYIKIAVCTQNPRANDTIKEYAAGFEVRAGVKIQVDIMKNCYSLAKKILNREHYDVICLGKKLWDIDSYALVSSIRVTCKETVFFLIGWEKLKADQLPNLAPVYYLQTPVQREEFRKNMYCVLSHMGPVRKYLSYEIANHKSRILYRDIEYIKKSGNSMIVHTIQDNYRIHHPMTEVEQELTAIRERFLRVHRDYLINSRYISWICNQQIGLLDGSRVPMSRIYKERAERALARNMK